MAGGIAGMPASPGIVDGPVHLLRWEVPDVRHRIIPDEAIPTEVARFHEALDLARDRLVGDDAVSNVGDFPPEKVDGSVHDPGRRRHAG